MNGIPEAQTLEDVRPASPTISTDLKNRRMEIVSKFIRHGRWYAVTEGNGRRETLPLANCNWLNGNPSFHGIPKEYVIHHLDLDPLNDDISNLALMYKHHHVAYHWKHKNCDVQIHCDVAMSNHDMGFDYPTRRPRVYQRSDDGRWFLAYNTSDGKKRMVFKINGRKFQSRKETERAINVIWPGNNWVSASATQVILKKTA